MYDEIFREALMRNAPLVPPLVAFRWDGSLLSVEFEKGFLFVNPKRFLPPDDAARMFHAFQAALAEAERAAARKAGETWRRMVRKPILKAYLRERVIYVLSEDRAIDPLSISRDLLEEIRSLLPHVPFLQFGRICWNGDRSRLISPMGAAKLNDLRPYHFFNNPALMLLFLEKARDTLREARWT